MRFVIFLRMLRSRLCEAGKPARFCQSMVRLGICRRGKCSIKGGEIKSYQITVTSLLAESDPTYGQVLSKLASRLIHLIRD